MVEADETVIATLFPTASYIFGSSAAATITIADDPAVVTITATDTDASETGSDPGVFTFARTGGNLASALSVVVSRSGTATNTLDYGAVSIIVIISANQPTTTVTISPLDDALAEGTETVTLSINPSGAFITAAPGAATVTIEDNDP